MFTPDRNRRELRNRARLALWLLMPFVVLMLLVSPRGDFPLNDDWVYAKMVQALADHGHLGFSPFSNAFAITQTLYAAPLVKLFGFNFTLLRLTTIFMGWVTVCFVAFTARELGLSNPGALLAAMTVFVNPLFINLCYTFMTDVPFCAFASISMYFFVKSLRAPTTANLVWGTLISIAAFYTRQIGILIPTAFVLSGIVSVRQLIRKPSVGAILCLAVPWAFALLAIPWLNASMPDALAIESNQKPSTSDAILAVGFLLVTLTTYIGLFLLPIAVGLPRFQTNVRNGRFQRYWLFGFLLFAGIGIFGAFPMVFFPFLPNILRDFGIGPALFSFIASRFDRGIHFAPIELGRGWIAVAYCATAAFCALAVSVAADFRGSGRSVHPIRSAQRTFLLAVGALLLFVPITAVPGNYFDRYILASVPPLSLLAAMGLGHRLRMQRMALPVFVVSGIATWSVIGLQDYMAWNTARWKAIDILHSKYHATDHDINGGFEFNGMYTSEQYMRRLRETPNTFTPKKWWVIGETYRVSPVDLTQSYSPCELIEKIPYYSWLGFETRYIYVLKH